MKDLAIRHAIFCWKKHFRSANKIMHLLFMQATKYHRTLFDMQSFSFQRISAYVWLSTIGFWPNRVFSKCQKRSPHQRAGLQYRTNGHTACHPHPHLHHTSCIDATIPAFPTPLSHSAGSNTLCHDVLASFTDCYFTYYPVLGVGALPDRAYIFPDGGLLIFHQ